MNQADGSMIKREQRYREIDHNDVPRIVIGRLAIYMRELDGYLQEGTTLISSTQLAERVGVSPAQVRKDLSYFGDFGKQGSGYEAAILRNALCRILHLEETWSVVLVGVGDLGRALIHNDYLRGRGFRIDAIFDNDPCKIGQRVGEQRITSVRDLEHYVIAFDSQIGVITTPALSAQRVADRMVAAGISCILNYTPALIDVPEEVQVQSIDPLLHFYQMTYYLKPQALRLPNRLVPAFEPALAESGHRVGGALVDKRPRQLAVERL